MYSWQAPARVEDSEDEAQAESVSSEAAKAAPKQQSKPGKHKKKKKKGKGDPGEKSEQAAPGMQEEEDLDKLLSDLNIQLVCLSLPQPDVHLMSVLRPFNLTDSIGKRAKASPQTSQSKQALQQKLRRIGKSCSQTSKYSIYISQSDIVPTNCCLFCVRAGEVSQHRHKGRECS